MTSTEDEYVTVIDFAPERRRFPDPEYDAVTGIEIPLSAPRHGTGCISAAEAQRADALWTSRRKREWDEIISGEAQRCDMTDEEQQEQRLRSIEQHLQGCISDLARLGRKLSSFDDADTEALLHSLNHLHSQAGSILCDLEKIAGRDWAEPRCEYGSLRLTSLGGYRIDPKTGAEMCPFSDYREKVKP